MPVGSEGQFLKVISNLPAWGGFLTGRQGGNASDWNTAGTTNYAVSGVKIFVGVVSVTLDGTSKRGSTSITFPSAFTAKPVVFVTAQSTIDVIAGGATSITTTGCSIGLMSSTTSGVISAMWLAIGPG